MNTALRMTCCLVVCLVHVNLTLGQQSREREDVQQMLADLRTSIANRREAVDAVEEQMELVRNRNSNIITDSIGLKLTLIPAGEFLMGSTSREPGHRSDEYAHKVEITKPFYLSTCETTVGQFEQFVDSTGYRTEAEADGRGGWGYDRVQGTVGVRGSQYTWRNPGFAQSSDHPVVNVSYRDAQAFCRWCTDKEGVVYRLPTEAEWEYACRAGTTGMFSGGRSQDVANLCDQSLADQSRVAARWAHRWDDGFAFTAPVGSFAPNPWSLHDMHGNVWEWVSDFYDAGYYHRSPDRDPRGPSRGNYRMFRGGGWFNPETICRSANRNVLTVADRTNLIGFRVVRQMD